MTETGGSDSTSTGTVGLVNVVEIVYTGIGLLGLLVSADTSQITLNTLPLVARVSLLTKCGILALSWF